MTGDDVRQSREQYDLTKRALAQLLGVHWTSVARWEKSDLLPWRIAGRLTALFAQMERLRQTALDPCPHCGGTGKATPPPWLVPHPEGGVLVCPPRRGAVRTSHARRGARQ